MSSPSSASISRNRAWVPGNESDVTVICYSHLVTLALERCVEVSRLVLVMEMNRKDFESVGNDAAKFSQI